MWHISTGMSKLTDLWSQVHVLIGYFTKSANVTQPIRSKDWSSMFYLYISAASSHVCCPDWDLTLSHGLGNRLCLDCTSLARAALVCLALNPLKSNYKTITVITFPKKWQWSLWWREPERRTCPQLCLSSSSVLHSFSPALLLSQLVAAAAVDIITVWATERRRVLTHEFLLWLNEILKVFCWAALRSKGRWPRHINPCYTLTLKIILNKHQKVLGLC